MVSEAPEIVQRALTAAGLKCLALVHDAPGTADLAIHLGENRLGVVRCARRLDRSDYRALATMLAQGDFERAVLVYCEREGSVLSDEIETWFVGDVEALAASLAGEAAFP